MVNSESSFLFFQVVIIGQGIFYPDQEGTSKVFELIYSDQYRIRYKKKKVMSPNNLCLTALLKAAERLNCSLFVHPWDMQMDGRMAKYWLPWLVGLCWTGVRNMAPTFEFFQLSLELCSARGRKWD